MATIVERVYSYAPEKVFQLAGPADFVRKLNIGNKWSRIRIGMLVAVAPNGVANITDATLLLGMCSGIASPVGSYGTANFIGALLVGPNTPASSRLLTYTAGAGNPYYSAPSCYTFRKFGQAEVSAVGTTGPYFALARTGLWYRRTPVYVDITRPISGSGACTISVYAPTTATVAIDYRPDQFFAGLDQLGTPVINAQTMTVHMTAVAANVGEEFGALDCLNLYWSRALYPLEISAIGASILTDSLYADGTASGSAETFTQYTPSDAYVASGQLSAGTNWMSAVYVAGSYTAAGTANPLPQIWLAGSSCGTPTDGFEQYGTGSITSGVTINAGTGWGGPAYINT